MPELPEVETVRRVLEPQLRGQTVTKVTLLWQQAAAYPAADIFCERLTGERIVGISRRGKFLQIEMEDGARLAVHLRMTGALLVTPSGYAQKKHTHVVLSFGDGRELRYVDQRKFGRMWFLQTGEEDTVTGMHRLGLEPFDERLDGAYLFSHLQGRKKTVKECLMDQSIVAGIGNIYADEILFRARLHPMREARSISRRKCGELAKLIPQTLLYYIETNAISAEDYLAGEGKDYRNTPYLQVYGHAGDPCPRCARSFQKITVGGRGSTFCARCQR